MLRSTAVRTGGGVDLRERKILRSNALLACGGVDLKDKKKSLRLTAVLTGGGVDSRDRERKNQVLISSTVLKGGEVES